MRKHGSVTSDWRCEFSSEMRLLLSCAHQQPDPQQTELIRSAVRDDIDWTEFLHLTNRHRVLPHAHLALSRAAGDLVPAHVLDELHRRFEANARRNLQFGGELTRICRAANDAGIPLMCIKGPALALQQYGGLECRQFRDIDLLARPGDFMRVTRMLNSLGYIEEIPDLQSLTKRQLARLMRFYKHIAFESNDRRGILLELHWDLSNYQELRVTNDQLWNDTHQAVLGNSRLHVLPPEVEIPFLAWHGSMHRWKRLSWLFDLAQAIGPVEKADSESLLRMAADLGVRNQMALGLSLVQALTSTVSAGELAGARSLRNQMQLSCRAMIKDEAHFEGSWLSTWSWNWRMSPRLCFRSEALFHTLAPRMEDIHRGFLHASLIRWKSLISRLMPCFPRIDE